VNDTKITGNRLVQLACEIIGIKRIF